MLIFFHQHENRVVPLIYIWRLFLAFSSVGVHWRVSTYSPWPCIQINQRFHRPCRYLWPELIADDLHWVQYTLAAADRHPKSTLCASTCWTSNNANYSKLRRYHLQRSCCSQCSSDSLDSIQWCTDPSAIVMSSTNILPEACKVCGPTVCTANSRDTFDYLNSLRIGFRVAIANEDEYSSRIRVEMRDL